MEYTSRPQEQTRDHYHQKPPSSYSPLNSPTSNGSNNNNINNNSTNSGVQTPTTPKLTPRSDSNPYATTFVQADSSNFKHVVQMLTGSSETTTKQSKQNHDSSSPKNFSIPPVKTAPKKQQGFKLYERRSQNLKNSLMINTLMPNFAHHRTQASGFSPRHPTEILSPSLLDFPSLTLSPVTPLNDDHFDKSSSSPLGNSSEEDRAIAEKGFYLHPSPRTSTSTPREPEPRLLPLFPVTSPRVSGSSS
ncbi:hypothetical protein M0R45_002194 [Rubus argutus]|uniref:VQ domain-containing protein n=1 Tax=Rubus argutus TaxID=59490 RepID=A0AAW1VNG9_RUBAR